MISTFSRRAAAGFALLTAFASMGIAGAQAPAAKPHLNMMQRHPYATGFVAGVATHHALKVAAARDKRNGKKLNWAERHPTLSAIGVGGVATHEVKAHTPH